MSETIRLLHVEDVASDAELIWRELRRAGLVFEPVRVDEEGTFLDRLRSLEPDIILSDYSLPHFNGMRALELAREHAPDVPVIIVTGSQNEETAVACMRAGAADYVIKEYLARLPSAIDSALRHRKLDRLRHEAEQRFALFMRFLPARAYILDGEGRYVFANERLEKLFGTPVADIVGKTLSDFAEPSSARAAEQNNALVLARGVPQLFEETIVIGGVERNYLSSKFPIILHDGSRLLGGTSIDVTEMKRAAEAVRKSEREFRSLAENLPDMIARFDRQRRHLYVNRHVESTTGVACGAFLGRTHAELAFPPALVQLFESAIDRTFETNEVTQIEFAVDTPTGLRYFESSIAPETVDGIAQSALSVARDVTEQQRRTALIRKLSQAIEYSPAVVMITSLDGTIEYVNPRFTAVTGYTAEEAIGANPRLLKSGQMPRDVYRELWSTIVAGGEWRGELLNRKKSGELLWEFASISAIRDDSGLTTNFVAVKEDITERKRNEAALRESEQQLLQAQKMEAVGRLAGGVAHDFNNILMAIMLQGNALVRLAAGNERMVKRVEEILKAGQRAATLTKQLLAFSRNDEASPKVLSPQAVVHNLRDMLQRLVSEDVAVTFELDRKCSNVYADGGQLEQVVMNLVINARDAMPRGGEIRVEVRNATPAEVDNAGGVSGTPYAILSVNDTGVGMDSVTVQRIFEPFFTTKPKDKGTGLGLSIVYGIVTRAGGLIRVISEPGRGTTFNVFMPTVDHDADRSAVVESQATETDLRGTETILLVEDDVMVRRLLSATLEANGYTVLQASDGAEALEVARKASAIDILLTDVVMPTVNGVEVARAIAASRPSVRVILMSGYADDVLTSYGLDASDAVLLHKPFTEDRLLTAVRSALGPVVR
jgi:two-component system cell cycle sensor histidine kinase/response regulator CckA